MIKIVVVNLRYSPHDILIDRRTVYGNRFRVEEYGRRLALRHFDDWIDARPQLVERLMKECLALEKDIIRFGCWCRPEACHGDILKRLVMERLQ